MNKITNFIKNKIKDINLLKYSKLVKRDYLGDKKKKTKEKTIPVFEKKEKLTEEKKKKIEEEIKSIMDEKNEEQKIMQDMKKNQFLKGNQKIERINFREILNKMKNPKKKIKKKIKKNSFNKVK
jgi:glycerophosphoryl diester phosphodiesterase